MAVPALLSRHLEELAEEEGLQAQLVEDGARTYIVFKDFPTSRYVPQQADLMLMADYQYPASAMDMFWTDPPIKLPNGAWPQNADQFENYGGRHWQRWSWHYQGWNPSRHSVKTHVQVVIDRLARGT